MTSALLEQQLHVGSRVSSMHEELLPGAQWASTQLPGWAMEACASLCPLPVIMSTRLQHRWGTDANRKECY